MKSNMQEQGEVFYRKDEYGNYYPVTRYDPALLNSLPFGEHLVISVDSGRIFKYKIDADYAPVIAAAELLRSEIRTHLIETGAQLRMIDMADAPGSLLEKYHSFREEYIKFNSRLYGPSVQEIVDEAIADVIKRAYELHNTPAGKEAFKQYQIVCKLAGEN
jgi:hypothetical protein